MLIFAIVCISIADALAKPTYLAALSVHVSPARQGIVIGTAQALIAIADFISPVLGGLVPGLCPMASPDRYSYRCRHYWSGDAQMIYLFKSSVLIVKPEQNNVTTSQIHIVPFFRYLYQKYCTYIECLRGIYGNFGWHLPL